MKAKKLGILLLSALAAMGCDDNTGTLGLDMLPTSDELSAHVTTFDVVTRSVKAENIYSKTDIGYIGKFTDPDFGYYESSFLSELNCTDHFVFPEVYHENESGTQGTGEIAKDSVTDIRLVLFYSSWFGDSLNACRMSAYELNDEWLEARTNAANYRYTDLDFSKYYDEKDLLGRKAYTAYDASIPDSLRNSTDSYGNPLYTPYVSFQLDNALGNRILQLNRAYERGENDYFDNADKFTNHIFKGVYIKNDYGDGTILYIDQVAMQLQFLLHVTDSDTGLKLKKKVTDDEGVAGSDSVYYGWQTFFASTKEIVQANRFANSEKIDEKLKETGWTYLKSPAGIFTEATLPYDEIYERLAGDTLNSVKLTFTNYNQKNNYDYAMSAPGNVLLVRKGKVKEFFEDNQLADNITSYTVTHNNVSTNQYTFSNIARLVTTCINEKNAAKEAAGSSWDEAEWEAEHPDWDKVWLIPVTVTYDSSSSSAKIISIQNDLRPGYAKLQGGPETNADGEVKNPLKLEVTYTTFHDMKP